MGGYSWRMFWQAVAALIPMIGVAALFWFAMRAVLNADRRERIELAKLEALENASAAGDEFSPGARSTRPADDGSATSV